MRAGTSAQVMPVHPFPTTRMVRGWPARYTRAPGSSADTWRQTPASYSAGYPVVSVTPLQSEMLLTQFRERPVEERLDVGVHVRELTEQGVGVEALRCLHEDIKVENERGLR